MNYLNEKEGKKGMIERFMNFIHRYVLEMILIAFMLLGFFWSIGYFANALYGMKFELQSCWAGFTAIGGAGVLAAIKYCMDSWKNSPEGKAPSGYGKTSTTQKLASIGATVLNEYAKDDSAKETSDKKEVSASVKS